MAEYPKRQRFFANRLVRLLHKSCAANEIGIEACWLITAVAFVEDSKRYSGAVTFWSGQLIPITGLQSWGRLSRARNRAVDAGWLHYIPGTNRQAAKYWTLIPDHLQNVFDDTPIDEFNHQNSDRNVIEDDINHQNGDRNVIDPWLKRDRNVDPSNLTLSPKEEERVRGTRAAASAKTRNSYPGHFEAIWAAYPKQRRRDKKPTCTAYQAVVKRVAEADDLKPAEAQQWLLDRLKAFAASHAGQKFPPEPKRWFANERYHDSDESWAEFVGSTSGNDDWATVRQIVQQKYSPDLRNSSDVEAELTVEQFAAAKAVGLSRIANADKFDKSTPEAYRTARKAVA